MGRRGGAAVGVVGQEEDGGVKGGGERTPQLHSLRPQSGTQTWGHYSYRPQSGKQTWGAARAAHCQRRDKEAWVPQRTKACGHKGMGGSRKEGTVPPTLPRPQVGSTKNSCPPISVPHTHRELFSQGGKQSQPHRGGGRGMQRSARKARMA